MNLPEIGDIITPVDDPCQFNPAWRSILATYLFSVGRWNKDSLDSLSKTGCVTVTRTVTRTVTHDSAEAGDAGKKKPRRKGKGKAKAKTSTKKDVIKSMRPVYPFYDSPEYRSLVIDRWISSQVDMMNDSVDGNPLSDDSVPFRLAQRWYTEPDSESAIKKRIEAMLLTEIGIDIITLDIIGMPSIQPAIEAYEKMYFNCRDENFKLHPSMQLISKMAMPYGPLKGFLRKWEHLDEDGFCIEDGRPIAKDSDVWRAVAATMGYEPLMYLWRWDGRAHGIKDRSLSRMIEMSWKASVSKLMSDMYTGNIAHEDAARLLASYTSHMKYMSDSNRDGGDGGDMTEAFLALLGAAAPKMRELVSGGAGMITDNDIQSRIESQQAIDKTKIQDAGRNVQEEVIDAQISNAIDV